MARSGADRDRKRAISKRHRMAQDSPPTAHNAVQQCTAGGAALLFLIVTTWVVVETQENVLFLRAKMEKAKSDYQTELATLERNFNQQRDSLAGEAERRRNTALDEAQKRLKFIQDRRDKLLASVEIAEETTRGKLRANIESEAERRRESNDAKKRENSEAAKLKLMPEEEALAKAERGYGRLADQQVEQEIDLRSREKLREVADANRTSAWRTKNQAEEDAIKYGWTRGQGGRMEPPNEPEGFFERGAFLAKKWLAAYLGVRDKLDEVRAAYERANTVFNDTRAGLDKCAKSLSDTKKNIALWAGKVEDKRKELNRKRVEVADELRLLHTQLDDKLRAWKADAENEYRADVGKLRQKGESDRASVRIQATAEEGDAYAQREAAVKDSYRWQNEARSRLENEHAMLRAKLQTDYDNRFKVWQKNETLRRLVGLLHVTTGVYALVLTVRCLLRWLQLRGWCSQQYLVGPP